MKAGVAFAALTLVALGGCGNDSKLKPPCSGISAAAPPRGPDEGVHLAGAEVELVLRLMPPPGCDGVDNLPLATGVVLEVTGPEAQLPAATASRPIWRQSSYSSRGYWETTVRFVPDAPGPWHLLADIGPGMGLLQREVWVAHDRSAELPAVVQVPQRLCSTAARTRSGILVCHHTYGGVTFHRSEAQVAQFEAVAIHVVEDVAWVRTAGNRLLRFTFDAAGVPNTGGEAPVMADPVYAVGEEHALVATADFLRRYRLDGSSMTLDAEAALIPRANTTAVGLHPGSSSLLLSNAGGWARLPLPYEGKPLTWSLGQTPVFQAPDGLWLANTRGDFHFVPADESKPHASFTAPTAFNTSAMKMDGRPLPGERPVLFPLGLDTSEALVPVVRDGVVQLHWYKAPAGARIVDVQNGELRAVRGNEQLFWPLER